MEPKDWKSIFDYYAEENDFYSWLNINVTNIEEGYCEMEIPQREKYYIPNIATDDWMHGGIISSLVDILAVPTAYTVVGSDKYVVTEDLSINFMNKAKNDVQGEAYVSEHKEQINRIEVTIEVFDKEKEEQVAQGEAKIVYGNSNAEGL